MSLKNLKKNSSQENTTPKIRNFKQVKYNTQAMYKTQKYRFDASKYEKELKGILTEIKRTKNWDKESLRKIQTKYPKDKKFMFSKNDLLRGYKYLVKKGIIDKDNKIKKRIRMKPIRTQSGVAPVTVLTKPWPCPGNCIYCPNEPNMPKSYIESEPGAQRAAALNFDPFLQVQRRIKALQNIGHNTEKIELIVLGGTWSFYPENYQKWFIKRCFEAMNHPDGGPANEDPADESLADKGENGKESTTSQNEQETPWEELEKEQKINETSKHRCVGLSLETRPDQITKEETIRMRRLGCTKVQIGVQTLRDDLLELNKRGHTVADTKNAFELLRLAGFKIQAHWMVNLYGANPENEIKDFKNLWNNEFQPDELKIYPTSIIENTKLYELYKQGKYKPYSEDQLTKLVAKLKLEVPEYCRITRVIRDIPAQEIVAGNKRSNLRQIAQEYLKNQGESCKCIRCREIRKQKVTKEDLNLKVQKYKTTISTEYFLSYVTKQNQIAGFLRLSIPNKTYQKKHFIKELQNASIIREIHVYGQVVPIGEEKKGKAQHLGLGKSLINKAQEVTKNENLKKLSVISAIGTREYYKSIDFDLNKLYMHKKIPNNQ